MFGLGLVGFGYWGPNLARNFFLQPDCRLLAICDSSPQRRALAGSIYPGVSVTAEFNDLIKNPDIDAVMIATPVSTHYALAKSCLEAGKDVLIEKPMTYSSQEGEALLELAERKGLIIFVDHTYLFTGAVLKIKQIFEQGDLGGLRYADSVRANLGLFNQDVNVIYDLAPHDLSIFCYLVQQDPEYVQALGSHAIKSGHQTIAYLHLNYPGGFTAHCHLSWQSPVKIRRMILGGKLKMIVFDDNEPTEKVKVYDWGMDIRRDQMDQNDIYRTIVDYRMGDILVPKVSNREALSLEADEFVSCLKTRRRPLTDGHFGLRVVRILEASQRSIMQNGEKVPIQ